jgi:hypothetical protein
MKTKKVCGSLTALAAAVLLTGCAMPFGPVPVATNFRTTTQQKLQAGAHWTAITRNMEQELGLALKNGPHRPLYVEPLQATPFNRVVANQLMTSLVNDGYVVSKMPADALKVEIDTQVVEFSADRPQYKFSGQRTLLVEGAWVLSTVHPSPAGLATALIAGDDAYTWFRSQFASGATPKTEIIVTISVSDQLRYYARYTSVYYTTDSDHWLYAGAPQPAMSAVTKSFVVKGG